MNIYESFINDFKAHYLSQNFQYGNNVYQSCLNDLCDYAKDYQAPSVDNIQACAELSEADKQKHDLFQQKYGIIISYYSNNSLINRPTKVMKINNKQYVSSYQTPIRIFDENSSWLGDIPATQGNNNTSYNYTRSFDVDLTNDRIAIACVYQQMVQVFRFSTGEYLFGIGTYRSAGDLSDGRLNTPCDVKFLTNGISCATS